MKRIVLSALLMLLLFAVLGARADMNGAGFSVQAILPQQQIDKKAGYFYVRTEPEQEQVLKVLIRNKSEEAIVVDIAANSAFTGASGMIDYSGKREDEGGFAAMVTIADAQMNIPAKQSAVAEFIVRMPQESFTGEVLGGLVFTKSSKEDSADEGKVMAITHTFNYCIAVRLVQGDIASIQPELALEGVRLIQVAGFPALNIAIRNQSPIIVENVRMDVWRIDDKGQTAIPLLKGGQITLAPLKQMDYVLLPDENGLPAGENERIVVTLQSEESSWRFENEGLQHAENN
jgi:Bacterial protein of unknown function (DUF916)./Protein of unknown function C-terminal (DUF3324).